LHRTGYELHPTPLFDGSTNPVFLNGSQVVQLEYELAFIDHVVDDPLVSSSVESLVRLFRKESQRRMRLASSSRERGSTDLPGPKQATDVGSERTR
jgi:hypothetical protein